MVVPSAPTENPVPPALVIPTLAIVFAWGLALIAACRLTETHEAVQKPAAMICLFATLLLFWMHTDCVQVVPPFLVTFFLLLLWGAKGPSSADTNLIGLQAVIVVVVTGLIFGYTRSVDKCETAVCAHEIVGGVGILVLLASLVVALVGTEWYKKATGTLYKRGAALVQNAVGRNFQKGTGNGVQTLDKLGGVTAVRRKATRVNVPKRLRVGKQDK